ncbi:MAG: hypothetical protein KF729_05390 [Sandaracinaceae bacterium]|nr:hypothetical protein [Sandaracinaceae bacterium]
MGSRLAVAALCATLFGCTAGRVAQEPFEPEPLEPAPPRADFRFAEPPSVDNDPFFGAGAARTEITLGLSQVALIEGALDPSGANEVWTDSDGYGFSLSAATFVSAHLSHEGRGGVWAVAIHRPDRSLAAWWGMGATDRVATHPVELSAGAYFVHVAAEPSVGLAPYALRVVTAPDEPCASSARPDYVEREASPGLNDQALVHWGAFPRVSRGDGLAEATGLRVERDGSRVIEGVSGAPGASADAYLDRDAYELEVADGVGELRVRIEHDSADVNLDVMLLSADGRTLVGAGVEIGDSPELAAIPVAPGRYVLWVGARDERAIGGGTALPLGYRAVVCGRRGAR